uniref:Orf291 n=1 Tax=Batis maritima TaxID=4436 RepID=A0A068BHI8_BATMA|nr:orf291 [Batis maritima]AIC83323.1 orf291 [Batis maritima]
MWRADVHSSAGLFWQAKKNTIWHEHCYESVSFGILKLTLQSSRCFSRDCFCTFFSEGTDIILISTGRNLMLFSMLILGCVFLLRLYSFFSFEEKKSMAFDLSFLCIYPLFFSSLSFAIDFFRIYLLSHLGIYFSDLFSFIMIVFPVSGGGDSGPFGPSSSENTPGQIIRAPSPGARVEVFEIPESQKKASEQGLSSDHPQLSLTSSEWEIANKCFPTSPQEVSGPSNSSNPEKEALPQSPEPVDPWEEEKRKGLLLPIWNEIFCQYQRELSKGKSWLRPSPRRRIRCIVAL